MIPPQLVSPRARAWNLELLDLEPLVPRCPVLTIQIGVEQDSELLFIFFPQTSVQLPVYDCILDSPDCVRCLSPGASVLGIVLGSTAHGRASKTQPRS